MEEPLVRQLVHGVLMVERSTASAVAFVAVGISNSLVLFTEDLYASRRRRIRLLQPLRLQHIDDLTDVTLIKRASTAVIEAIVDTAHLLLRHFHLYSILFF